MCKIWILEWHDQTKFLCAKTPFHLWFLHGSTYPEYWTEVYTHPVSLLNTSFAVWINLFIVFHAMSLLSCSWLFGFFFNIVEAVIKIHANFVATWWFQSYLETCYDLVWMSQYVKAILIISPTVSDIWFIRVRYFQFRLFRLDNNSTRFG